MKGIGSVYTGVSGALRGKTIAMIIAMAAGGAYRTALDLNGGMERWADRGEKPRKGRSGLPQALLPPAQYCEGMAVGGLQSGLRHDMLYTKSLLDGISAIVLTASLGIESRSRFAVSVLIYQGVTRVAVSLRSC